MSGVALWGSFVFVMSDGTSLDDLAAWLGPHDF